MRTILVFAFSFSAFFCMAQKTPDERSGKSTIPQIDVHVPQQPVKVVEIERAPAVAPEIKNEIVNEGPPLWLNLASALAALATIGAVVVAAKALKYSSESANASKQSAETAAESLKYTADAAFAAKESVEEMRRQAAASRQPDILAYIAFHEESDQLQVVIENFGGGPATNVSTSPPAGLDQDVDQEYYIYSAFSKVFAVMPSGYRFATPIGPPHQYRGNAKLCSPFSIKVKWQDLVGAVTERELMLDVTPYVDAWSPRSHEGRLADSVEQLARNVKWLADLKEADLNGVKIARGIGRVGSHWSETQPSTEELYESSTEEPAKRDQSTSEERDG